MKRAWMVLVAMVAGLVILSTAVRAAEEKKDAAAPGVKSDKPERTVVGTVVVTKDAEGKVKEIRIGKGNDAICVCTSSDIGKSVATFEGKRVKATGTVEEKGGKKVLMVSKIEETKGEERSERRAERKAENKAEKAENKAEKAEEKAERKAE